MLVRAFSLKTLTSCHINKMMFKLCFVFCLHIATVWGVFNYDLNACRLECDSAVPQGKCPQTKFDFPRDNQVSDFIRIKKTIPSLTEFTTCTWITPLSASMFARGCSYVSYAILKRDNVFLLFSTSSSQMELIVNAESRLFNFVISGRTHICVTVNTNTGSSIVYRNGLHLLGVTHKNRKPVPGGGAMTIGQEQDQLLGGFDPAQAFAGTIENLMMWHRVLDATEVRQLHSDSCKCPNDYALSLSLDEIQLEGKVVGQPTNTC